MVICSNDCVDDSPLMLDGLHALQLITHLPVEPGPGEKPQPAALSRADALPVVREADWIMVLDGDDFLNIHVGNGSVADLLDAVPDAAAILVNWRMFGHSGHDAFSDALVTERFTRAALPGDPVSLSFKTLFTRSEAYAWRLSPHGPGYAHQDRVAELRYVNGAGALASSRYATAEIFLQSEPGEVSWAPAQVNHYNTRSRDDYVVKHHRGGGLDIPWNRAACWAIFNKNGTCDCTIQNKIPRTRAVLASLLEDRELRLRHERCCQRYAAHIAALKGAQRSATA